jgi:hypothetical protein
MKRQQFLRQRTQIPKKENFTNNNHPSHKYKRGLNYESGTDLTNPKCLCASPVVTLFELLDRLYFSWFV